MQKRLYISLIIILISKGLVSQTFWNNASVYVGNQTVNAGPGVTPTLYVGGDVEIAPDLGGQDGVFKNDGEIELVGNWLSNVPKAIDSSLQGDVTFSYDPINSGVQFIQGMPTDFWRLNLNNSRIELSAFQTYVEGRLDLMSAQLETHQNIIHVLNTDPSPNMNANAGMWWSGGYVSTDTLQGGLVRSTKTNGTYAFPIGSPILANNYRNVDITPNSIDSATYMVAMRDIDASTENTNIVSFAGNVSPYDIDSRELLLFEVTDQYYFTVDRPFTNDPSSDVRMKLSYFTDDNPVGKKYQYKNLANWDPSDSQWKLTDFVHDKNYAGPADLNFPNYALEGTLSSFGNDVFAIGVKDGPPVFIPQIFSPNGDGMNDLLYVYGNRYVELKFVVYDRWGEKVFETTDKDIGWDGKFKGKNAQSGVYVYYIDAVIRQYGRVTQKGNITLVR